MTNIDLCKLLPYDTSVNINKYGEVISKLKEYKFLISALNNSIDNFQKKKYQKLDSLVGENACQTRGVFFADMARDNWSFSTLIDKINLINQTINELINVDSKKYPRKFEESFDSFLKSFKLDLELDERIVYMLGCRLLQRTKVEKSRGVTIKEVADPKRLSKFGNLSGSFFDRIVRKLRQKIASDSVCFVQNCAQNLNQPELIKMTSKEFVIDHNSWPCTPMFWTYKALLMHMQQNHIPIVVKARFIDSKDETKVLEQIKFAYKSGDRIDSLDFKVVPFESINDQACCIFEGIVVVDNLDVDAWKKKFDSYSLKDIILSGVADHRQYPDEKYDARVLDLHDPEFESYREMAKKEGFSMDNPSTFFIQHVYAAKIDQLDKVKKSKTETTS
jgi:hypothetical protein